MKQTMPAYLFRTCFRFRRGSVSLVHRLRQVSVKFAGMAIHRLRKRYRELFRQEIADTVADPAEVESELRFLAAMLARK